MLQTWKPWQNLLMLLLDIASWHFAMSILEKNFWHSFDRWWLRRWEIFIISRLYASSTAIISKVSRRTVKLWEASNMEEITEKWFSHKDNFGITNYSDGTESKFDNIPYNGSAEFEEMSKMVRNFYDDLSNTSNYLLIAMYVPVIIIAVTANIIVIVVVCKNQYMRRYYNRCVS